MYNVINTYLPKGDIGMGKDKSIDNTNKKGINVNTQDNNANTQEKIITEHSDSEDTIIKQSNSKQKAKKKSGLIKKNRSQKKKEQSKYLEMLDMLLENRNTILSYKSGRKAFKKLREDSYDSFIDLLEEYSSNKGVEDCYYSERSIERRYKYLEWVYGLKEFKNGNDLSKYNKYFFDYIIDAPYAYYDNITKKTYFYIELHYVNKITALLINSESDFYNTFLYKVVADQYEMDNFKRKVKVSQKLAMRTSKTSPKYTFFHDSINSSIFYKSTYSCHTESDIYQFSSKTNKILNRCLRSFKDVLIRFDLMELWGLLVNYIFAHPNKSFNNYYVVPDKANNNIAANFIHCIIRLIAANKDIPVLINPDKRVLSTYEIYRKNNDRRIIDPTINGIILKKLETDSTEVIGINYLEYCYITGLLKILNLLPHFTCMRFDDIDNRIRKYLFFTARYNSTKSNETSLAAFNGIFYFYVFFIRNGVIKYDMLFEVFEYMFEVEINKDEMIRLGYITEKDVTNEKNVGIDITQGGIHGEAIVGFESDVTDMTNELNTVINQYNKDDIEGIYQSMCQYIYNNYKKDKDKDGLFIRYIKSGDKDGLCFEGKGDDDDRSVIKWIKKWIVERYYEADEDLFERLLSCILKHNKSINKETVRVKGGFKKYNVTGNKKYYIIFLDITKPGD